MRQKIDISNNHLTSSLDPSSAHAPRRGLDRGGHCVVETRVPSSTARPARSCRRGLSRARAARPAFRPFAAPFRRRRPRFARPIRLPARAAIRLPSPPSAKRFNHTIHERRPGPGQARHRIERISREPRTPRRRPKAASATSFPSASRGVLAQAVATRALADQARRVGHHAHDSLPGRQRASAMRFERDAGGDRNDERIGANRVAKRRQRCADLSAASPPGRRHRSRATWAAMSASTFAPGTSFANACRASRLGSLATIAPAGTISARTSPRASAVAMRPAPIKPIRIASIESTRKSLYFQHDMVRQSPRLNNVLASNAWNQMHAIAIGALVI